MKELGGAVFILFTIILITTVCVGPGEPPSPLPTYTPLSTYTPLATYTPAVVIITPTPVPTYTPLPTYTPYPTATPYPTSTPIVLVATPTVTPTPKVPYTVATFRYQQSYAQTPTFTVRSSPWKLEWIVTYTGGGSYRGYHWSVRIKDPETGGGVKLLLNETPEGNYNGATLVYGLTGTYFLEVNGPDEDEGFWEIRIIENPEY